MSDIDAAGLADAGNPPVDPSADGAGEVPNGGGAVGTPSLAVLEPAALGPAALGPAALGAPVDDPD